MSKTTSSIYKKERCKVTKKKNLFLWLGLVLLVIGLGAVFYFIDPPDIKELNNHNHHPHF